jgi:hypothetical protein
VRGAASTTTAFRVNRYLLTLSSVLLLRLPPRRAAEISDSFEGRGFYHHRVRGQQASSTFFFRAPSGDRHQRVVQRFTY